jgi:hypothetical protein
LEATRCSTSAETSPKRSRPPALSRSTLPARLTSASLTCRHAARHAARHACMRCNHVTTGAVGTRDAAPLPPTPCSARSSWSSCWTARATTAQPCPGKRRSRSWQPSSSCRAQVRPAEREGEREGEGERE